MRIDGNRGIGRSSNVAGKSSIGASGFSSMIAAPKSQAIQSGLPVSPLASIIGLSEEAPEEQRRRKAVRRASSLLDELDELHRALCLGTLDHSQLEALASKLGSEPSPEDPELADLIGQIEVRIAVELARHDKPAT